jgi:hypothetical protein
MSRAVIEQRINTYSEHIRYRTYEPATALKYFRIFFRIS